MSDVDIENFFWLDEDEIFNPALHEQNLGEILVALQTAGYSGIEEDEVRSVVESPEDVSLLDVTIDHNFNETLVFPDLQERHSLDQAEGTSNLALLSGDAEVSFHTTATFTMVESGAGYNNTLGAYTIAADGTIQAVELAFTNVKDALTAEKIAQIDHKIETFEKNIEKWQEKPEKNADKIEKFQHEIDELNAQKAELVAQTQYSYTIDGETGSQLGMFIIADGASANHQYKNLDLEHGTLEFIYDFGGVNERAAKITDSAADITLIHRNGNQITVIEGEIYHATGRGDSTDINPDNAVHVVSGLADPDDTDVLRIGFEDLKNLGDADFNDVVFDVSIGDVTVHLPKAVLAENLTLSGTESDDILDVAVPAQDPSQDAGSVNTPANIGAGDDVIYGRGGNDIIYGRDGNDTMYGGTGDDIFIGGAGDDFMNGNEGNDTADYNSSTSAITVNLNASTVTDGLGGTDTLYLIETIIGSQYDDTISGKGGQGDHLYGGAGNDTIDGRAGDDFLYGEAGNDILLGGDGHDFLDGGIGDDILRASYGDDILVGGAGNDYLHGEEGFDTADYSSSTSAIEVNMNTFTVLDGLGGTDTLNSIESVVGSGFNDTMLGGGALNDTFYGGAGNDVIDGKGGDDTLYGGTGNDSIQGGSGNDILYGDEGNDILRGSYGDDVLVGGAGRDILFGGEGADTFVFLSGDNFDSYDSIKDFNATEGDKIDISDLLTSYDPLTDAIEDFVKFTTTKDGLSTQISVDVDGGGDHFQLVGFVENVTGMENEQALVNAGQLVV